MSVDARHSYRFGFLKSEEWQGHRKIILSERKAKCAVCGIKDWSNDVHHVRYRRNRYLKIRSDFEVLCRNCHEIVHIVLEHRKRMGASSERRNGWRNVRRSAKRILRNSKVIGLANSKIRAKAIFNSIFLNRSERLPLSGTSSQPERFNFNGHNENAGEWRVSRPDCTSTVMAINLTQPAKEL